MNLLVVLLFIVSNAPLAFMGLRLSCGSAKHVAGTGRREMVELAHWSDEISADDGGQP